MRRTMSRISLGPAENSQAFEIRPVEFSGRARRQHCATHFYLGTDERQRGVSVVDSNQFDEHVLTLASAGLDLRFASRPAVL